VSITFAPAFAGDIYLKVICSLNMVLLKISTTGCAANRKLPEEKNGHFKKNE
jgi:hypothetical protein